MTNVDGVRVTLCLHVVECQFVSDCGICLVAKSPCLKIHGRCEYMSYACTITYELFYKSLLIIEMCLLIVIIIPAHNVGTHLCTNFPFPLYSPCIHTPSCWTCCATTPIKQIVFILCVIDTVWQYMYCSPTTSCNKLLQTTFLNNSVAMSYFPP